jgi:hypothetical protein
VIAIPALKRWHVATVLLLFAAGGTAQEEGDEVPESVRKQIRIQFGEEAPTPKKETETPAEEAPPPPKKTRKKKKERKKEARGERQPPHRQSTLPEPDDEDVKPPPKGERPSSLPTPDDENEGRAAVHRPSPEPEEPDRGQRSSGSDESPKATKREEEPQRSGVAASGSDDIREADRAPAKNETTEEASQNETEGEETSGPKTLTVGLGGAYVALFGLPFRIPISGTASNDYVAYGESVALRLSLDLPFIGSSEARIGIHAALPGFIGIQGLAGISQDLATSGLVTFVGRGAGGVEIFVGSGGSPNATFIAFDILGEGEMGAQLSVGSDNKKAIGLFFEVDARYSIPLGLGFTLGATLRGSFIL